METDATSRILVLSYWNLNAAAFGGGRRIEALLKLTGPRTLLLQPRPAHPRYETVTYRPNLGKRKLGINWGIFNFHVPATADLVRRTARERKPALVIATSIWAEAPMRGLEDQFPVVLDAHDVNAVAIAERFGARHPFTRLVAAREAAAVRRVRHVFACSENDRALFIDRYGLPPDRVTVVPNGTELDAPARAAASPADPAILRRLDGAAAVLFFMGKLDYQPNVEALRFLAAEVLPELERLRPGAFRLLVTGGPVPAGPFPPSMIFAGRVPDIAPYLLRADVCLAPLFSGSGTRLKILEYLGAGKPVVATPKGAEGLDAESGRHLVLAEPARFAEAVARVASDPAAARALGESGLALVRERYTWDAIRERWRSVLGRWAPGM